MKLHQTRLILFLSTALLLIGSSGIFPHPASSQSTALSQKTSDSDATVPNLTDGDLNWLAITAAIGTLLSLGTNLLLFLKIQQVQKSQEIRSFGESVKKRDSEYLIPKKITHIKGEIDRLFDRQTTLEEQFNDLNRQALQRPFFEETGPLSQGYRSSRKQQSSPYNQSPTIPSPHPNQYPGNFAASEQGQQSYSWDTSPQRPASAAISPYVMIVQNYNTNPSANASNAQGVSETEESISRRRSKASMQVTLQTVSNYSYWVIGDSDNNYWLVPKPDLKLNPMNFDTFQSLFDYQGQPSERRLNLMRPAKVTHQTIAGEWELIERGEVEFV